MTYDQELQFAETLAKNAMTRAKESRDKGFEVSLKGPNDLVTDIDRATEKYICDAIRENYPDDAILGEEYGESKSSEGDRRWIIDPIDGTMNFVQGIPFYCVSIALEDRGMIVVGAIYDPSNQELFSGTANTGVRVNGRPARVSETTELNAGVFATGFVTAKQSITLDENLEKFCKMTKSTRGMRRLGSAALDLAYVACGRLDGFWEYDLSPWDVAAGALLVKLAGGAVSTVEGGGHELSSESILATNFVLHEAVVETLSSDP